MSEPKHSETLQALRSLEEHFSRDEVELLRGDQGFINTLVLAGFHRMAAERQTAFVAAKADAIRARIELLRSTHRLAHLDSILQADSDTLTAEREDAKRRALVSQAERQDAEAELALKKERAELRRLELARERVRLEAEIAAHLPAANNPTGNKPSETHRERIERRIDECTAKWQRKEQEFIAAGLNDDHPYVKQRRHQYEAEINELRRQL